ncbi:MAG: STAS domain-containing protein [Phycisphaerae bacterium]
MDKVGPLTVMRDGNLLTFTIGRSDVSARDLPSDYDAQLARHLAPQLDGAPPPDFVLDLEDTPAISSRQLGVMLALHKALKPRRPRLPIKRVSAEVRNVLDTTRTSRFFEIL